VEGGIVLVHGENGAGKTNLLEALHVATQGFSPRTRSDRELIRFGAEQARVAVRGTQARAPVAADVVLSASRPKEARLNGERLGSPESLRRRMSTLVFTPDRLAVVKGGPAVRRAYFDRALGRLTPARAALPFEYAAAVAQRNAALRRVAARISTRDALAPWTGRAAALGADLVAARHDAIAVLAAPFAERAGELGLADARIVYEAEPPTAAALEERLERDLERGTTGLGPHLDEIALLAGSRDLRHFGSQGEQRLAVLALILAEAEVITDRVSPPLLLLDDVLSELDSGRRRILAARVAGRGQTVITATAAAALPVEPAQLVHVTPGRAEEG
jgi:DNA replication and repair protein RecF